ncbi:Serine/threonine protein kinase PrkC, regulator of stationary phase [Minicystis rosea]|nr:Serine/threonine protein kinase PrkC, regulator of stationary phase [Minicystis rosea]
MGRSDEPAGPARSLSLPPPVDPAGTAGASGEGERYEVRRVLGKGAMGEVLLCRDTRIGRDVAKKVMAGKYRDDRVARARFLREARIQGQLEHPAIVPVHDLDRDEHGAEYFTMKCLRGETLAEIVRGLAAGDAAMMAKYPLRRLLSAFSAACLAVDFAHARGVLHRDLKPANIMLGAYGEVYVLDWGIAKITEPTGAPLPKLPGGDEEDLHTATGKALGTWGYMAPEQARGRIEELSTRTDVYALGAILFEILAREPLHKKDVWNAMLMSTVAGVDARASRRAPTLEIPPELDAVCVKATTLRAADRHPSARAVHEAVERYLEGDRDVELRRQAAAVHAERAEEARARAAAGGSDAEEAVRTALQEVGRALALDPTNRRALSLIAQILTAPQRAVPAAVSADLDAHVAARHRHQLRLAFATDVASITLMTPIVLWMGVRSTALLVFCVALTLAAAALKLVATRMADLRRIHAVAYAGYVCNILAVVSIGRGFGPLLFTPMLLTAFTFAYCMTYSGRFRAAIIATSAIALLASVAADLFGLVPSSYAFHDGAMTILPRGVTLAEGPTLAALLVGSTFMVIIPGLMMSRMMVALRRAEERTFLQAWHLKQLLPDEARAKGALGEA